MLVKKGGIFRIMIRDMEENKRRWIKYELGKFKTRLVIKTYVKMLMSGKIEWEKLGQMYRPDQKQPVWTLKRLLKQTETQNMITDELIAVMAGHEISQDTVIEGEKRILKKAEEKEDLTNALKVLTTWAGRVDLNPTDVKQTFSISSKVDYKAMLEGYDKKELGEDESE